MSVLVNRSGQRFGRLVVLPEFNRESGRTLWLCRCDCGVEKYFLASNLVKANNSKSCGCLKIETAGVQSTKHSMCSTKVYRAWSKMKARCDLPSDKAYANYGGRGIRYCPQWKNFEQFFADMGHPPSPKHSLDRYPDNNGNYKPSNCRWATSKEQASNRRITVWVDSMSFGRITLVEASQRSGIAYDTLKKRVRRGLTGRDLFAETYSNGKW